MTAEEFPFIADFGAERASDEPELIVDVEGFEGPLDLLLTLARQQKVDLAKISILALATWRERSARPLDQGGDRAKRQISCEDHADGLRLLGDHDRLLVDAPIAEWNRSPDPDALALGSRDLVTHPLPDHLASNWAKESSTLNWILKKDRGREHDDDRKRTDYGQGSHAQSPPRISRTRIVLQAPHAASRP